MASARVVETVSLVLCIKIVPTHFSVSNLMSIHLRRPVRDKELHTSHAQAQSSAAITYTAGSVKKKTWFSSLAFLYIPSSLNSISDGETKTPTQALGSLVQLGTRKNLPSKTTSTTESTAKVV
jgi:hypothetical protein